MSCTRMTLANTFADPLKPPYPLQTSPCKKVANILSISVVALLLAIFAAFLQTALLVVRHQTTTIDFVSTNARSPAIFYTEQQVPASSSYVKQNARLSENPPKQYVLVLDFWERMVNIQSSLRRLVNIGIDADFTVVEPFLYQSKTSRWYSAPDHFTARNLTSQPASLYFRTADLLQTHAYVSYQQFQRQMKVERPSAIDTNPRLDDKEKYLIHAAVFFDWPDDTADNVLFAANTSEKFAWCDERLRSLSRSVFGYALSQTVHVQRALCLNLNHTVAPARLTPAYFHKMFSFVSRGTVTTPRRCRACVAVAFMNYRKHAFSGFTTNLGTRPFEQKVPPMEVSLYGNKLAQRVRKELFKKEPYIALQLRTGKAFVLFDQYEKKLQDAGTNVTRHETFKKWLISCTSKLTSEAKALARKTGRMTAYYIASDMYNDGWKGGEKCPEDVRDALESAKAYIERELRHVYHYDPVAFGAKQDHMGLSGVVDAAMCRQASRFLYAKPSNFGRWVAEQRQLYGEGGVAHVDCMDERLAGA